MHRQQVYISQRPGNGPKYAVATTLTPIATTYHVETYHVEHACVRCLLCYYGLDVWSHSEFNSNSI